MTMVAKSLLQSWDLDEIRCSCGFPETNVECDSLLLGNNPTEAPSEPHDSGLDAGESGVGGGGAGDDDAGTPTWVIVTAIAMVSVALLLLLCLVHGPLARMCVSVLPSLKAHSRPPFSPLCRGA